MGMVDQAVINFACYEDAKDFLGLASVTLPDVDFIIATISGAGIAGNVEAPIIGHMNAMTTQIRCTTRLQVFTRRSLLSTSLCLFRRRCRTAILPRQPPQTVLAVTPRAAG